jgi:hypothetical protein
MFRKLVSLTALGLMLTVTGSVGAQELGQGKVLFEYWTNIGGGTSVDNDLRTNANFPDNPSSSEWRDNFKSPVDWADNAGTRARAFVTPPQTGDYTFWVAGDDNCQLWLSPDTDAANAVKIAEVLGWTPADDWLNTGGGAGGPEQKSAPQALVAGQKYYIEALMKEGGGGDSVSVAWGGPGIGDGPTLLAGTYCTAFVRSPEPLLLAQRPDPASGTEDVTNPLFQWTPGITAVMHDVYFGTNPEPGAAEFKGSQPFAMYFEVMPLVPGATYYWRVDETDATGTKYVGNVWSFTVMPLTAHFPSPVDGALWRKTTTTVSWTAGQGAVSHKVFGDTDRAAVEAGSDSALLTTQAETSLDASALLEPATTYYWRVDEVDSAGVVTPGPVWTFTTLDPAVGGAVAEFWDNRYLTGAPKLVKTVPEINFDWGSNQPDAAIPADNFSARFTAELNVPVSGKYRIYEASDDGARTFLNGVQICAGWADRGTTEDASAELDLVAGERYLVVMEYYENGGGAAAFLRWSGPGIPKEIIPQGALMPPKMAFSLSPSNGAVNVDSATALSWLAVDEAATFNVYLSKNKALVAAGDASVLVAQQAETSFTPAAPFDRGTTNFWKVDVVAADGTVTPGMVSSFRVADKNTDNWAAGASAAKYLATFVQDGLYDIGTFGGEQTYEFVVRSNPDEQEASMCLIGRRQSAETNAGLKYEQWENTGTYGATLFGVADYDYGVATAPGEYTHLVFVSSAAAGTTELYVNGVLQGSVAAAITLSGVVGIGYGAQTDAPGYFDNFDGDIFGVAIYDKLLSAGEIAMSADRYFNPIEITDPDLLIYYDFETGSGNVAIDQSGHSNHGYFAGSPEWTTGIFGGCLSLDQTRADYVETRVPLGIVTNTVSVSGWVKHDAAPTAWSGILTHRGTSPGCLGLQHDGKQLKYMWGADQYWQFNSGLMIPNGEWYFAALTISPTQGKLYLNGLAQTATNVAEHVPTNFDKLISVGRDIGFGTNRLMTAMIDEVRLYNRTLTDVDIQRMVLADVTAPGDAVQGVPNDGDWPGAEYPALAIDNKTSTKFLHFKGAIGPSGIQVTPALGPTVVTGLTFTTANDEPPRDPVKFELSGSNDGIDGPWTLIASGDIADFAGETAWLRFTMNATGIAFENAVAYKHYQLLFPAIRNAPGANSMQIAEVELLGVASIASE